VEQIPSGPALDAVVAAAPPNRVGERRAQEAVGSIGAALLRGPGGSEAGDEKDGDRGHEERGATRHACS
jgi:hypothetical protein